MLGWVVDQPDTLCVNWKRWDVCIIFLLDAGMGRGGEETWLGLDVPPSLPSKYPGCRFLFTIRVLLQRVIMFFSSSTHLHVYRVRRVSEYQNTKNTVYGLQPNMEYT